MQTAIHATIFDRIVDALRDYAVSFSNARFAAMDIERLHRMSDDELALRGVAREDIPDYVYKRYLDCRLIAAMDAKRAAVI